MAKLQPHIILDKVKDLILAEGLEFSDLRQNEDLMRRYVQRARFILE